MYSPDSTTSTSNYIPNPDILNNDGWTSVSYSKKRKELKEKKEKKKEDQLDIIKNNINIFLKSLEDRDDFVFLLEKQFKILDCRCKELLDFEKAKYKQSVKNIKRSKTLKYFDENKKDIETSIKNLNQILNKNNIFKLIGMELITDQDDIQLKDLPEFKDEVKKYENYLIEMEKLKEEAKETKNHLNNNIKVKKSINIDVNKNIVRQGVSFASII